MSQSLSGSRYELRVTHDKPIETRPDDYFAIHPADGEPAGEGDDLVGYVHSWEAGSTVDGPGIRFVAFLTGCWLRCQFCHNPDTWHKLNGRRVTVAQAMREIGKYAQALKISGGGLTLSGGEPMVQRPFTMEIFRRCRQMGLHTCLDTSGRLGATMTDEDMAEVDLHLLDVKSGDPAVYERITGHPLQPTLDYATRLSAQRRPMWIRFVLVPGLSDGYDNVERVADFVAGLNAVERVEILRFHQMGREKWHKLGIEYPLENVVPPDAELTGRVREQFRARGLTAY